MPDSCVTLVRIVIPDVFFAWHPQRETELDVSLSVQGEDHVDRCINLRGNVAERVGSVAPGLDRIEGGLPQHGGSADYAQVFQRSGLRNGTLQHPCAGEARRLGDGRIDGLRLMYEQTDRDAGRNSDFPRYSPYPGLTLTVKDIVHCAVTAEGFHSGCANAGRRWRFCCGHRFGVLRNPRWCDQLIMHH